MDAAKEFQRIWTFSKKIKFTTLVSAFCFVLFIVWVVCGVVLKDRNQDKSTIEIIAIVMIVVGVIFLFSYFITNIVNVFWTMSLHLVGVNPMKKILFMLLNTLLIVFCYLLIKNFVKSCRSVDDYQVLLNNKAKNNTKTQQSTNVNQINNMPNSSQQQYNQGVINQMPQQDQQNFTNQNNQQFDNYYYQQYQQPSVTPPSWPYSQQPTTNESYPSQQAGTTSKIPPIWNGSLESSNEVINSTNNQNDTNSGNIDNTNSQSK